MISLFFETLIAICRPPFRKKEILDQIMFVGNQSLPIILLCVSFAAIVTILESSFHMKIVIQNDFMVPGFAALLILRELGAMITALLLASRVGAGYASEIGSMQITEQVDALKMLNINPVNYLVVPRFIGSIIGTVLLTAIANVVCILAAMLICDLILGYTYGVFLTSMNRFAQFQDLMFSLIKAACFGAIIPIVACYFGFRCKAGAEGVGRATTSTVVVASVGIIGADFILTFIFSYFY